MQVRHYKQCVSWHAASPGVAVISPPPMSLPGRQASLVVAKDTLKKVPGIAQSAPVLLVTFILTLVKHVVGTMLVMASCTFLLLRQFLGICSFRVPDWFSAPAGKGSVGRGKWRGRCRESVAIHPDHGTAFNTENGAW